jgi:DNA-binding transcriptional LysR family regulator
MQRGSLADLTAFIAVADHLSFRAAASRLGVTPSALSHSMRQLEERLEMRLLHRTTPSVSLTDAGVRLLERLRPAVDQVADTLEHLNQERARPFGRLRIYVIRMAAASVIAPGVTPRTVPRFTLETVQKVGANRDRTCTQRCAWVGRGGHRSRTQAAATNCSPPPSGRSRG